MKATIYSYRFAEEIISNAKYQVALKQIKRVIKECPLYIFPGKSKTNKKLTVVQQLLNTYFDRRFAREFKWEFHPNATTIPNSDLKADYKKDFKGLRIQAEVQFGNMARWYSDIFKFQTAYSQDLIDMGLCIVPMSSLASVIDSNITNFQRCIRELPSAKLSITLPILIIGIEPDKYTRVIDVSKSKIGAMGVSKIIGKGMTENRYRIVNGIIGGADIKKISIKSAVGDTVSDKTDTVEIEAD